MRLTLRTLLAYLDDLLEPAQAKELGAKIQESEKAAELIMRIRDVIRKRRLTAPVVNGPGCDLDANLVAEYLDNTLPPEGVADLEKICLDSDTHLAEVAACHQILTLVLGEPVDIGSHSRERMYALGQAAAQMGAAAAAEHSAEPESVTGNRGKPTAPMITPATVGLNRKAIHDLDQPRRSDSLRGDSFIGKGQATAGHPSASLPGRPVPAVGTGGTNGQRAGHSGILSAPEHAAAAPQSMSKSTIISNASSLSGLGPAVKSVSAPRPASATTPASDASANPARNQSTTEPFDRTIPDYLKQPPLWKRALPVAVLLLIAVWVGTLLKDKDLLSGLLGRRPESTADNQLATTNDAAATTAAKQGAGGPSGETPSQAAAVVQSDAAELQADADSEKPQSDVLPAKPKQTEVAVADPGVDAPPPLEAGDSTNQTKATAKAPVPKEPESPNKTTASKSTETEEAPANSKTATEVAIVDTPRPGGPGKTPAKTVKPAPAVPTGTDNRPQPVRYVSQEGVVLRFDDDRQGWFPLPHRQFVFAEDILAVPEPFDAQFQFGTEKHRLTALGPTLFQVIETMDDLPLAINVERGKILVQPAETAAGTMPARLKLSLNVQGQTWLLELPDANSRCGIEIIPREPNQFEENFGPQGWSGRLVVASGTVKVTTPEGKAQIMT
ncbi:MAG: hypothetical protein JWM11_4877, partial [Planctomycetaceae bacterium]|nr:hypothetical protein [Planctomycetaceae bacterium]